MEPLPICLGQQSMPLPVLSRRVVGLALPTPDNQRGVLLLLKLTHFLVPVEAARAVMR